MKAYVLTLFTKSMFIFKDTQTEHFFVYVNNKSKKI